MKQRSSVLLHEQIASLEEKRENDLASLKQHLKTTGEKLKPSNLMKSAIKDVTTNQEVRSVFKKAVIGMIMGVVTDKIVSSKPAGKASGLIGMAVNVGINLLLANRYTLLKSAGALAVTAIVTRLRKRKERKQLARNEALLIDSASG